MSNNKKAISMALATIMTAGTLFSGTAGAAPKKTVKKPVKKAGITNQQMANYKAAVNAVVVLENGIKKYGLTKTENIAYAKAKSALAKAALAKAPAGSSKNGLLARVAKCDAAIAAATTTTTVATLVSVENPTNMTVNQGAELKLPETVVANMSNNTTKEYKVTWDKTVDVNTLGETALTGTVVGTDKTVTMKVTVAKVDIDITAITPLSLKQVKIEFNKAVVDEDKKDDIENIDNYELRDKDNSIVKDIVKEVKLDDSKKFAVVTFKDVLNNKDRYEIENQETYGLTISEDVTGKEKVEKIAFKDLELPKVETIEVAGIDTIKVKFSEPIKPFNIKDANLSDYVPQLDKEDFSVNDGKTSIRKVELVNNNREANIVLSGDLKDKDELSVKVKGGIQDYAGLGAISETKTITVAKDDKAPEIVGFKNIQPDEVTIVFDKDVKFRSTSKTYIENTGDFYHTNDKNVAKRVDIDGKEVRIQFDTVKGGELPDGSAYVYVKADVLESLWGVKNEKNSYKVSRTEDNVRPTVVRVEQDKDSNAKIKVRFSEKVKEKEATDKSNYKIEDDKGKTISIKSIILQENDKEALITTNKDLDADIKYKITVQNVEDKSGNVIKTSTTDLAVKDTLSVDVADVTLNFYSLGSTDQKLVINFDKKMTTSTDQYSALDLAKYTLVSDNKDFNGKTTINLGDVYKSSIKSVRNGEAIEIAIPYYSDKTNDKSYNLNDLMVTKSHKLNVEIARVADVNGNLTAGSMTPLEKNVTIGASNSQAGYDTNPEAQSVEQVFFAFDKVVSFDQDDVKLIAADNENDVKAYAYANGAIDVNPGVGDATKVTVLGDTSFKPTEKASITEITATLSRNLHQAKYDNADWVLDYDGTYAGKTIYAVVIPTTIVDGKKVTKTDTDYNETLKTGYIKVKDAIAPVIMDNSDYTDGSKYLGVNVTSASEVKDDQAVEYYLSADKKKAAVVMTFTENIDPKSLSTSAFDLKGDSDLEDCKIDKVYAKGNKVIIEMSDDKAIVIGSGNSIAIKGQMSDMEENKTQEADWSATIGDFKALTDAQARNLTIDFVPALTTPAAPTVAAEDTTNVITGITTAMEYSIDAAAYVTYDAAAAPDLTGTKTVKVRVKAVADVSNASADTTLTFTTNLTTPAAPSVTADDTANVITGITTAMEYSIGGAAYVTYDAAAAPDLTGTKTVKVRVKAVAGVSNASVDTTVNFN